MSRKRRGFTLIELLVVVSIIALLIAILLPSLGKAREQAKRTLCLANLKGIGTAMHEYAGAYDGVFPGTEWSGSYDRWVGWDQALDAYITGNPRVVTNSGTYRPLGKIFQCPALLFPREGTQPVMGTYSSNLSVLPYYGLTFMTPPLKYQWVKTSTVLRASEVVAAGDSNQNYPDAFLSTPGTNATWVAWDYDPLKVNDTAIYPRGTVIAPDYNYQNSTPQNTQTNHDIALVGSVGTGIRYRHGESTPNKSGYANVVFVDGHAEPIRANGLKVENLASRY